ncbi:MAG TPA: SLC13 family permease, partial [Candidatus Baltobacteraceae bacterium]
MTWIICWATLVAVATRAARLPEALWAAVGACALVSLGLLPWSEALAAISRGTDVYLFLLGMMVLAELLRRAGVFDWLAAHVLGAAHGSPLRLLALIYLVGVVITAFLSNDATAVVLAPAVATALARTNADPLPYLYACAFVANAASFLLPISNPANLVVYGDHLPRLGPWVAAYGAASVVALLLTFAALALVWRGALRAAVHDEAVPVALSAAGLRSLIAVGLSACFMVIAALRGYPLGAVTASVSLVSLLAVWGARPAEMVGVVRAIAWSIVPLVAGLFVVVSALDRVGFIGIVAAGFGKIQALPPSVAAQA